MDVVSPFAEPFLHETADVFSQRFRRCYAVRSGVFGKVDKQWNPPKHNPGRVIFFSEPNEVPLDEREEPTGSETISCFWFLEVSFDHATSILGANPEPSRSEPGKNYVPSTASIRPTAPSCVAGLRHITPLGTKAGQPEGGRDRGRLV